MTRLIQTDNCNKNCINTVNADISTALVSNRKRNSFFAYLYGMHVAVSSSDCFHSVGPTALHRSQNQPFTRITMTELNGSVLGHNSFQLHGKNHKGFPMYFFMERWNVPWNGTNLNFYWYRGTIRVGMCLL